MYKYLRFLIPVALLMNFTSAYSQFFVGNSKQEVKSALMKNNVKFTEQKITDTTNRISWLNEKEFQMIWVFNNKDSLKGQTLISEKHNGINEFVKWFNEDFVIISPTEWRNYSNGVIYNIKLEKLLNEHLFSITLLRTH